MRHIDDEEQEILDALRACATGKFSTWTLEQHQVLDRVSRHPHAVARAACAFLEEHRPPKESVWRGFDMDEEKRFTDGMLQRDIAATTGPPSGETIFALCTDDDVVVRHCGVCGQSDEVNYCPVWIFSRSGALCGSCAEERAPVLYRYADDLRTMYWAPEVLGARISELGILLESLLDTLPKRDEICWDSVPDFGERLKVLETKHVRTLIAKLQQAARWRWIEEMRERDTTIG